MSSENGWEPAWVGADRLNWVDIPGCDVRIQTQKGQPTAILRAWIADHNAYIEPVRDRDTASYTPTNSVSTSNHLNGTAADINWDSHPFHAKGTFTPAQMKTLREMLDFYEDTIFWAGDWASPIDEMHVQLGYDTYNNPHTQDFINRKIRSDGYSTFRRGAAPELSKPDGYALAIIREGQRRGVTPRGIQIALATALVESNLRMYANAAVPESLNLPHDAVGSDHDSVGLFQQRCPMWGPANILMDPTKSAGLFYDRLVKLDYNGNNTPGSYAQAVQRSAFPYRYDERYADAVTLYNRLATVTDTDPLEELLMSDPVESLSLYATPGEPKIPVVRMLQNVDAAQHRELVENDARYGDPDALSRIIRVAAGQGKYKTPGAVNHAKAVLADIEANNPAVLKNYLASKGQ